MSTLNISSDAAFTISGTSIFVDSVEYFTPLQLINDSGSMVTVTLDFTANSIGSNSFYIIVGSDNITFNGLSYNIVVASSAHPGLIRNGTGSNAFSNIVVKNINVITNPVLPGGIAASGGCICQRYFGAGGTSNTISNCSSSLNIANLGGGISGASTTAIISNCHSTGHNLNGGGGIVGALSMNCTITACYSTGSVNNGGGGIFGQSCNRGGDGAVSIATKCYSLGNIGNITYNCGGIFGANANQDATNSRCTAEDCFSAGIIHGDLSGANGGIFGTNATGNCVAYKCYSIGSIGISCGGIFQTGTNLTARNCYSIGSIGSSAGGIFGPNVSDSLAKYCYSTGAIGGSAGGIFGSASVASTATNCYSIGAVATYGGGIFGENSTTPTATECYMTGSYSSDVPYNKHYQIFGSSSSGAIISNCYSENPNVHGQWNDSHAKLVLQKQKWIRVFAGKPYLLAIFNQIATTSNDIIQHNGLAPPGYIYSFITLLTITSTRDKNYAKTVLQGFYSSSIDEYSANIYGYAIATYNVTINLS